MKQEKQAPDTSRFIIAIIPPILIVLFSLSLFVHEFNNDINFIAKEVEGVHEVQSYYQHMYIAQKIRGLRQLQIGGHAGLEKEVEGLQRRLVNLLQNSWRESHANWLNVKAELKSLSQDADLLYSIKDTPASSLKLFDRYSQLNLEMIVMIKRVADSSNLTLDPELESHLLEEMVVDRLPSVLEHVAIMRGLTAYGVQQPAQRAGINSRLNYQLHALTDELKNMRARYDSLKHGNSAVVGIKSGFELLLTSTDAYIEYVKTIVKKNRASVEPLVVFEQGSATIDIISELAEQANAQLMRRLLERKEQTSHTKNKVIFGVGLGSIIFLGIVLAYFRSNRNTYAHLSLVRTALESAQSRNSVIIDTVVDGIISIDESGIIHDFNPSAERIFGYSADEVIGRNINILMPEPYSTEHDGYMRNYLTTGEKKIIGIGREVDGLRKDGSVFPLDLAVNEMQIEGRRFFTGIVRDITERKRIEVMKNEFISTVSHELRTPLTSIRGALGLIAGGAVGIIPEKAKDMLTIASNNTERLLVLINDILDLQKIESGKMAFKFKVMPVKPFLEQAIRDNQSYADQYGVKFEINKQEEDLRVFADRDRLTQVVANLLSNAAKFSPYGSTVEVSAMRHKGAIRISVTDHGPGIPMNFRSRIFEKFSQSDASDARQKGGTGLGLNISKRIIEKHGGRISFITRADIGTTFYFDLPELSGKNIEPDTRARDTLDEHVPCVLIVEDDQDVAALLRRMLAEVGFASDVAYSAKEARALLEKNIEHYQAMTLDIILPDEDGLSLLRSMRAQPKTRDLPIVIISVKADEGRIELNGGAVGVLDWLSKPIDQHRLISTIQQAASPNYLPRVLHVEDDEDIHKIVGLMLQGYCELVWTTTLEASKQVLEEEHIDLVLLDIELPDGSGLDLLANIEHRVKPPRVVIFSANEVPAEYAGQVNAVLKKSGIGNDELLKSILGFIKR